MERSVKSATTGPYTDSALHNEHLTKPLLKDNNNVEVKQQRFTSSLTINKFKTLNGYVSIIVKSENDAAEISQSLHNTTLVQNALNSGEGDVGIIESSSKNYEPSATNNSASRAIVDSSDTLHFDIELMRLRAEEKRLEVESERLDAKFRKTDREGWLKKQEMDIRKLELEKDIKGIDLKKLELMDPKELMQSKFKGYGNLVKQVHEDSEISNSVNSSGENYAFSGEIFMNQVSGIADPLTATVFNDTAEVQSFQFCKPQSAREEDTKGDTKEDTTEDTKPREEEISLSSILKHRVILDNLELTYGLTGHLTEGEVLNSKAQEDIQREGTTRYEQCEKLLNYINDSNLNSFLDGLRRTMQSHLAEYIDCSLCSRIERESDRSGDWPLDEEERKTINKLYVLLVKDMATNEVLDDLISEECISELHRECINGCGVKFMRNRELLDIMRRRSKKQLKKFWELVIKYSQHLKVIIEKFLVPGSTLTLVKVNIQDNLTEEQKLKIKNNSIQPRRRFSNRDGDEPAATGDKNLNFCVSGEEIFAIVPVEELEIDSSSMIVSEETKSLVNEALISCTGGDEVIVETLENVEYREGTYIDENSENDVERRIFSLNTSTRIIQQKQAIAEVTVVDDKIFVVQKKKSLVKVYNLSTLTALPDINIPDMKNPVDIAGCSHNKVLYISDDDLNYIHKVNITDNSVKRWSVRENYEPWGLSVTSEHNVLVTVSIRYTGGVSRVVEYTSEGQLIREIEFDRSIQYALQTLELSTDRFIICHGSSSSVHRVCVINFEGEIIKCFGGERGRGEDKLWGPSSLTIDKNRQVVFEADRYNDRIVMLDYEMNYLGLVQSRESLVDPSSVTYDFNSDQLIVGGEWDTRLLIISPKF